MKASKRAVAHYPITECAELKKCEEKYHKMSIAEEDQVSSYFRIRQQLDNLGRDLRKYILKPVYLLPFLQPGRLIRVSGSYTPGIVS